MVHSAFDEEWILYDEEKVLDRTKQNKSIKIGGGDGIVGELFKYG